MICSLAHLIMHAMLIAAMLPRLAGVEHERLVRIAETRSAEYAQKIEALALEIAAGKTHFQFPLQDAEEELVARSAVVRVVDPYLGAWLSDQFICFNLDLSASDLQQREWDASNTVFDGMFLDPWSSPEGFAFYAQSMDPRVNQKWMALPLPRLVDPVGHVGAGPRHENTYIALLESMAFQPHEGTAPGILDQPALNHSRAAWMRVVSSYLIDYSGKPDDRLRAIATEVLRRRIVGPETSSIMRAVWIETYAAIVPDVLTGATMAEAFMASLKPCEVIAGARAAYGLIHRSGSEQLRVRLCVKMREALHRGQPPVIAECLERLVGYADALKDSSD